ncbi:MAG: radical SAM protein [Pseudomonadota bacterium]
MSVSVQEVLRRIDFLGLRSPTHLTLMITDVCNLRCRHCLLDCSPDAQAGHTAKEPLMEIIEGFARMGGKRLMLTGGEPLLHPDWPAILSAACSREEFAEVCLQTNAVLLTEPDVKALERLSDGRLFLQVSLEGPTADTNDVVRGAGSFQRIVEGLHRLVEAGLGMNTRLAFTEMRHNFDHLPRMFDLAEEMGLGRIITGTMVCGGRAAKDNGLAMPTPGQYRRLLDRYHSDMRFRDAYRERGNIAAIEWHKAKSDSAQPGCTCIETPFISAAGRMYPCVMLLCDEYSVENVHSRGLEETICSALDLWSRLPEIHRRRRAALESCEGCPGRSHCNGGCMGRAYAAAGDFMSPEDRCSLRRAVYSYGDNQDSRGHDEL